MNRSRINIYILHNLLRIIKNFMGASLVYLDRPVTKKETKSGSLPASQTQVGFKYSSSAMQGWRLNMVSYTCLE